MNATTKENHTQPRTSDVLLDITAHGAIQTSDVSTIELRYDDLLAACEAAGLEVTKRGWQVKPANADTTA